MKAIFTAGAAVALAASCVLAADMWVKEPTALTSEKGKALGTLHVAAKVNAISQKGDKTLVEYSGYVPEGGDISYARLGVLEQDFDMADQKQVKIVKKVMDEYDNEWQLVTVKGLVATSALEASSEGVMKRGKDLFEERCSICHALHPYDEFAANVWPSTVDSMKDNTGFTPVEREEVIRFLQSKAPTE